MGRNLPFRLTLASGSVGRRWLLQKAGYTFDIRPADIDEPTDTLFGDIRHYVHDTAWRKANAVAPTVADGVVLAADSVAWIDQQVIGKPTDADEARRILTRLAGRVHELWTGVVLWRRPDDVQLVWQERARVRMRPFVGSELDDYLASNRWVGCSGAYSIAEENDPFLEVVEGTISNVIGLPIESLERLLLPFGASA